MYMKLVKELLPAHHKVQGGFHHLAELFRSTVLKRTKMNYIVITHPARKRLEFESELKNVAGDTQKPTDQHLQILYKN